MPLTKRAVSPVDVSRHRLPAGLRDGELECTANGTLANLVRQLSSLSRHAENIFGEIFHEAMKLEHRTNSVNVRLERLTHTVTQLDTLLQDILLRKPFKSNTLIDQQSLARQTLPLAMSECYARCERPPDLDSLNVFRTDNKSGLKFYTNPEYFFDLWRDSMLRDAEIGKRAKQVGFTLFYEPNFAQHPRGRLAPVPESPHGSGMAASQQNHQQMLNDQQMNAQRQRKRQQKAQREQFVNNVIKFPEEYHAPAMLRAQQKNYESNNHHIPHGMVRPQQLDGLQHNGHGASYAASGHNQTTSVNNVQRYNSMNAGYSAAPVRSNFDQQEQYAQQEQQNYRQQQRKYVDDYSSSSAAPSMASAQHTHQHTPPAASNSSANASVTSPSHSSRGGTPVRPTQPPPAPPPPPVNNMMNALSMHDERDGSPDLPPPPPPLMMTASMVDHRLPTPPPMCVNGVSGAQAVTVVQIHSSSRIPPAPPPPPPTMAKTGAAPTAPASAFKKEKTPAMHDPRNDLLRSIRQGVQLKKAQKDEEEKREQESAATGHDVAAILQKRMKDVMGGSSDEDGSEDGSFGNEWDD